MKNQTQEIIAIGDIHGRKQWENIVSRHPKAHFVFLGDYCDPYVNIGKEKLLHNLKKIINLKKEHPNRVTLLLGNHDLHYFVTHFPKGSRYDFRIASDLQELFTQERALFDYAYEYGQLLFTHAGISQTWMDCCWHRPLPPSMALCLNQPEKMEDHGAALYTCGPCRGGLDPAGGIFWADEEELECSPTGYIQITGHNRMKHIRHIHSTTAKDYELAEVIICDCLASMRYLLIDHQNNEHIRFYEMDLNKEEGDLVLETHR